jgi:uncharacterized lipoprotein YmbA
MTMRQMTLRFARQITLCSVAVAATAGCFTLARPTPPLQEFVIGTSSVSVPGVRDAAGLAVGLRRLDLAPYLATTAIVVRRGSRIVTSGFRRWGEEPSAGIMRAVAQALTTAPSIQSVDVAPWPVQARHDYLVQLHISRLEGVAPDDSTAREGEVRVTATWELLRARDGIVVARGRTDRREPGWRVGDYPGLVGRVDRGLTGLASDLVACLRALPPESSDAGAVPSQSLVCDPR